MAGNAILHRLFGVIDALETLGCVAILERELRHPRL